MSSAKTADTSPIATLDHLVVAARDLEAGAAWCKATLGVAPSFGGRHALMGTHNLLLSLSSPRRRRCYLEIIAVDADAPVPRRTRWFDLDAPAVQRAIAAGPCLVHWVAATTDMTASLAALGAAGYDVGTPTSAERATSGGLLRWYISLRIDGGRPADGAVPLLIEWDGAHPCDTLPDSGVRLERIELGGVASALAVRLGASVAGEAREARASARGPALAALLQTPLGSVTLASPEAA